MRMNKKYYQIISGIISAIVIFFIALQPGLILKELSSTAHSMYLLVLYIGIPLGILAASWRKYKTFGIMFVIVWAIILTLIFILGGLAIQSVDDLR